MEFDVSDVRLDRNIIQAVLFRLPTIEYECRPITRRCFSGNDFPTRVYETCRLTEMLFHAD